MPRDLDDVVVEYYEADEQPNGTLNINTRRRPLWTPARRAEKLVVGVRRPRVYLRRPSSGRPASRRRRGSAATRGSPGRSTEGSDDPHPQHDLADRRVTA
jgi:hypothetical protein